MHEIAVEAVRPAGAPEYADVCFRYGWVREDTFPTVEDAKKAMRVYHATRVDWFYPGSLSSGKGALVTPTSQAFIDWCHDNGMKVGGAINTNTTNKDWAMPGLHGPAGRLIGDPSNADYVRMAVAWGTAQIDAGVDTLVCDDFFRYRSGEQKRLFSDNVIAKIKAHKPGFTIAGNNGGFIEPRYVKDYAFDFHYSDNNYRPGPGRWWAADKAHRALNSAVLLHPNVPMAKQQRRTLIALGYATGGHVITPWDEYIHGKNKPRLFADPADFADLYGFVRALDELGYMNGYEDAAVGGYDLKETRYGENPPIAIEGGSGKLSAFARAKPGHADAPVVIHLVESGEAKPATLHLRQSALFGARKVECKLYTPSDYVKKDHEAAATSGKYNALRSDATLKPAIKDGMLIVELPALTPWGVVVISPVARPASASRQRAAPVTAAPPSAFPTFQASGATLSNSRTRRRRELRGGP